MWLLDSEVEEHPAEKVSSALCAHRWRTVYFLTHKSEALKHLKKYVAEVLEQKGVQLKRIHSDRGTEYLNAVFKQFCLRAHRDSHEEV